MANEAQILSRCLNLLNFLLQWYEIDELLSSMANGAQILSRHLNPLIFLLQWYAVDELLSSMHMANEAQISQRVYTYHRISIGHACMCGISYRQITDTQYWGLNLISVRSDYSYPASVYVANYKYILPRVS